MKTDLSRLAWRKSSRSQPTQSDCVELAGLDDAVVVRDSKDPHGPLHVFECASFRTFLIRVKTGELNL